MEKDIRFYETFYLILHIDEIIERKEKCLISSATIDQLFLYKDMDLFKEDKKDIDIIIDKIRKNDDIFEVIVSKNDNLFYNFNLDIKALMDAYEANESMYKDEVIYVTANAQLAQIANLYFGDGMIELIV